MFFIFNLIFLCAIGETSFLITSVYLINRTPSPFLNNHTPFKHLWGRKPTYYHLRTFGYLCYASTLTRDCHKFSPRAAPAVFLGYPPGYKGYKLLDLTTNVIFVSCDVVFHEHIFPFHNTSQSTSIDDFFSNSSPDPCSILFPDSISTLPTPHSSSNNTITSPSFSHPTRTTPLISKTIIVIQPQLLVPLLIHSLLSFPMLVCLSPIMPLLTPFRHISNLPLTLKQLWI